MKSIIDKKPMFLRIIIPAFVIFLIVTVIKAVLVLYKKEIKEKFSSIGSPLSYSIGDGVRSSWLSADKRSKRSDNIYSAMETNIVGSDITNTTHESELFMFNKNKFTPECCPSAYSNSTGCLCATPEQMKYLNSHGGNRTIGGAPSEY